MKYWKSVLTGWLTVCMALFILSGCGEKRTPGEWNENGLAVEKDGQVVYCVVDSFDKGFYDVGELTGMAVEEAALFNGKNRTGDSAPVTVEEVAAIGEAQDRVRVLYRFDKSDSYEKFQEEKLYYGTLKDGVQERHIFSGAVLVDGEGTITLDESNVERYAGNHVIVTDAKNRIYPPYDVLFYSEGVEILSDGSVSTASCGDTAILVLKK